MNDVTVYLTELPQQSDTVTQTQLAATLTQIATKSTDLTLKVKVARKGFALVASSVYNQPTTAFTDSYTAIAPATGSAAG